MELLFEMHQKLSKFSMMTKSMHCFYLQILSCQVIHNSFVVPYNNLCKKLCDKCRFAQNDNYGKLEYDEN